MATRSQPLFEDVSDEGSVNTNTTAESELNETGEYPVEKILAEDVAPDGEMHYLLKWEGYPLYRCTWEKKDQITSELLLRDWHNEKLAVRRGEKLAFDLDEYSKAFEKWQDELADKRERRIAKRRKRGEVVHSAEEGEVSESEDELFAKSHSPKRSKAKSLQVKRKGIARSISKERTRVLTLSDDDSSGSESDSLLATAHKPAPAAKSKTPVASTTLASKKRIGPNVETAIQKAKRPSIENRSSDIRTSATETVHGLSKSIQPQSTTAARKSVPATTAKSGPQRPRRDSNVFTRDWTEEKKRRQRARVSGETPKDSTDPKFTNLSTQNRYQKYGRNEPAPNPEALIMVDPKTGKAQPPQTAPAKATKVGPPEIHSAYGRRTPPRTSKVRSPSPPTPMPRPPALNGMVTAPPTTNTNVGIVRSPTETPASGPIPKRNVVCIHWQAGNCNYTADICPYMHAYGPLFAQSKKQTTCFYWQTSGNCKYTADQCDFAHFDTGIYAGQPGSFKRRSSMASNMSTIKASDPRLVAGSSSPGEVFFDAPEQPPAPPQVPPLAAAKVNGATFTKASATDSAYTTATRLSGLVQSPTVLSTITNVSPTTASDPRLAGQPSAITAATVSPAKDPRLRSLSGGATQSPRDPLVVEAQPFMHGSIEADLEMAKKCISTLDSSRLVKTKSGQIKLVYIHMPRARAGELGLLDKYFKTLNCEVFHNQRGTNLWKHFRETFEKFSCLLIFHPSETFMDTIPELSNYLVEKGAGLRVFSIGVQHRQCIMEQREPAYEAQRLFPHGGITFITDDVFVYYPEKATEIIEKFLNEAKDKPPGAQLSKIGARPGVKDWMASLAARKFEEQGGEGRCTDLRWIECYEALCRLCPVEDDDPDFPEHSVPLESSHLWSVWEESLPSFKGRWERGDEEGATDYMANHFAGEACAMAWKYRKFLFVYQRPGMEKEVTSSQGFPVVEQEVDPKGWMKKYCHISVVTPEQALRSKGGKK